MKVGIFDLNGKLISTYLGELDESSTHRPEQLCPPHTIHVAIPDIFVHDHVKIVWVEAETKKDLISESVIIPAVPNQWYKEGVGYVFEDPQDETFLFIPGSEERIEPAIYSEEYTVPAHWGVVQDDELLQVSTLRQKEITIQELKAEMEKDVLSEMARVFGTSNMNSASANKDTWQLMIDDPALFVGHMGFTTESEVIAFGTAKMSEVKGYAVYRAIRIEQFKKEVALL